MADDRGRGVEKYIEKAKAKALQTLDEKSPRLTKLELAFRQKFLKDRENL